MALDPAIPLGVQPVRFNSPFEQLAQIRAQQQEQQYRQAQIADVQAQAADRANALRRSQGYAQALITATSQHATPQPDGSMKTDDEAIARDLTGAGFGVEAQKYLDGAATRAEIFARVKAANDAHQTFVEKHNDDQADQLADIARGITSPFDFVNHVQAAVTAGALDPKTGITYVQQATSTPDAWQQIQQQILAHSPSARKEAAAQRAQLTTPRVVPQGSSVVVPSSTGGAPTTLVQGAPKLERVPGMLNGQQAFAMQTPEGKFLNPATGEDVTTAFKPTPTQTIVNVQNAAAAGKAPDVTASRPDPTTANKVDPRTGLTPNAIHQAGIGWAMQGVMPSMGMGNQGPMGSARAAIINKGSALAAAAGTDIGTLRAEYKANSGALSKILPIATMTAAAAGTANDSLQLAADQAKTVPRSNAPIANTFSQWLQSGDKALVSNPDLAKLQLYIYTAAREYAKVTTGAAASVQGLTDAGTKAAEKLLSAAQSPDTFASVIQGMQADMGNVTKNQMRQIKNTSSTIANFLSAATGTPVPTDNEPATPASGASTQAAPSPAVTAILTPLKPGRHTLSDGSVWDKKADGSIVKVP